MIGLNDLGDGRSPELTAEGILAVVKAIRSASPNTKVLLLGLLPPGVAGPGSRLITEVQLTNTILSQSVSIPGVTFEDFSALVAGHVDSFGHPASQGYAILAKAIQGPLTSLLVGSTAKNPGSISSA